MKVVVNKCFGGYSLSPLATKEIATLKGKECYFFDYSFQNRTYTPLDITKCSTALMWSAFSVNDPNSYHLAEEISLSYKDLNRDDTDLVKVVETLGEKANGLFAKLEIIEIPDGVEYEIDEYDGMESIHEKHRSW